MLLVCGWLMNTSEMTVQCLFLFGAHRHSVFTIIIIYAMKQTFLSKATSCSMVLINSCLVDFQRTFSTVSNQAPLSPWPPRQRVSLLEEPNHRGVCVRAYVQGWVRVVVSVSMCQTDTLLTVCVCVFQAWVGGVVPSSKHELQ